MSAVADETTLVLTRTFDAAPAAVFDAWIGREEWAAWIGPEGIECEVPELDACVGGRYRISMRMSTGEVIPVAGVFKVIDRPHRLVFTWGWDGDPSRESLITLTFRGVGTKTEFMLVQEGLGSMANRDGHEKGWTSALHKLARHLASSR